MAEPFLLARGLMRRSAEDQPTVFVTGIEALPYAEAEHDAGSHDFH